MKSREISRSKIGPFSLACTDPYIGTGWEYQSSLSLWYVGTVLLSNTEPIKNVSKNNYGWSTVFGVALIRKQKLKHSYNKTLFTCWTGDIFFKFRFGTGDRFKKPTENMCMHNSSTIQSGSKQ